MEGRPIPSSSSFLMSEASEYRGGGEVNYCSTSIAKGLSGCSSLRAGSVCSSLAVGTPGKPGQVELWHRYKDFTGEYVLHCHFLGHEDRGMMFNVQTVCKDDPTKWGKSTLDEAPECVPGNLIPASPKCPATAAAAASSASE